MPKSHTDKSTTQSTPVSTSEPSVVSSSSSIFKRAAGKSPVKSGYKPEYKVRLSKDDNPDDYENAAKGFFRVIGSEIKAIFKALFGFLRNLFSRKKSKDLSSMSSSSISPSDLSTEASSTSRHSSERSVSPSVTRSEPGKDNARAVSVSSPSEASVRPPKSATPDRKSKHVTERAISVKQARDRSSAHSGSDPTAQPQVLAGGNPAAANPPVGRQLGSEYTFSSAKVREWLGGSKSTPAASAGNPKAATKIDIGIQVNSADIDAEMNSVSPEPAAPVVTSPAARAESSATTVLVAGNPVVPAVSSVTAQESLAQESHVNRDNADLLAEIATVRRNFNQVVPNAGRDNANPNAAFEAELKERRQALRHVESNAPRDPQDDSAALKAELARVKGELRPAQIASLQADVDVNSRINEWLANIDSDRESMPASEESSTEYQVHDGVTISDQERATVTNPIAPSVEAPNTVTRPIPPSVVSEKDSSVTTSDSHHSAEVAAEPVAAVPPTLVKDKNSKDPHAELLSAIKARRAAVREAEDKAAEERAKKVAEAVAAKPQLAAPEQAAKAAAEAEEQAKQAHERKVAHDLLNERMKARFAARLGDTSDSESDNADTAPVIAARPGPGKLDPQKFNAVAQMLANRVAGQQPAPARQAEKPQGNSEAVADAKAKLEAAKAVLVQQSASPAGRVVVNPNAPKAPPPPPHLLAKADGAKANAAGGLHPAPPSAMPKGWKPQAPVAAAARSAEADAQSTAKPAESSNAPAPALTDELKAKLAKRNPNND